MREFLESRGIRVRTWTRIDNRGTCWEHPDSRAGRWNGDEPTITAVSVGGPNSQNVDGCFWVPLAELQPLMQCGEIVIGWWLNKLHAIPAPPECPPFLTGRVLTREEYELCRQLVDAWWAAKRRVESRREVHRVLNFLRRVELIPGDGDCTETIRDRKSGKQRSRWSDSREDMILALIVDLGAGYDWPAAVEAASRTARRLGIRQQIGATA